MFSDVVAVYRATKAKGLWATRGAEKCTTWIPKGARLEALEEPRGGWVRVRYQGRVGYCLARNLSNVEDEPE